MRTIKLWAVAVARAAAAATTAAAFNGQTFVDRYRRVRRAYSIVMRAVSCLQHGARGAWTKRLMARRLRGYSLRAEVDADDFFVK